MASPVTRRASSSLLGLLRRSGPLTATQAAAELGDSVPNCSFHLRQLARGELAGSACAVAELGEPSEYKHCRRIYRRRSHYFAGAPPQDFLAVSRR